LGLTERVDEILEAYAQEDPIGVMELQLASLQSRGRHKEAWTLLDSFIAKYSTGWEDVDPNYLSLALVSQILAEEYNLAIGLFDRLANEDPDVFVEEMFPVAGVDVLNALAYAYVNTGNINKANELLDFRHERVVRLGDSTQPALLETLSLNQALQGDTDAAYEILALAVDSGWANYYRAINDPRWRDTLRQPRFVDLLERAQDNLAQQREVVLARESGEN
jgi:tetratricopeptide (TPR) repeat protein